MASVDVIKITARWAVVRHISAVPSTLIFSAKKATHTDTDLTVSDHSTVVAFLALKMVVKGTAEKSAINNFRPRPYSVASSNFNKILKTIFF